MITRYTTPNVKRLGYPTQNLTILASTNRTCRLANLCDAEKMRSLVRENLADTKDHRAVERRARDPALPYGAESRTLRLSPSIPIRLGRGAWRRAQASRKACTLSRHPSQHASRPVHPTGEPQTRGCRTKPY